MKTKKSTENRFHLIDCIRGLAVVNMVVFHLLFDIFEVFGVQYGWYQKTPVHIWQQSICLTFIFISGFVFVWGRKGNLKRGLLLNIFGLVISLVTLLVEPSEVIWFGILNFYGCAILLMIPVEKLLKKVNPFIGAVVSFTLFLLFRNMNDGYIGLFGLFRLDLPQALYDCKVLMPLGFPFPSFFSSDYFPVFPWSFWFVTGYFGFRIFEKFERAKNFARFRIPVLDFIGRKAIWIYLLHQPVCYGACLLLFDVLHVF